MSEQGSGDSLVRIVLIVLAAAVLAPMLMMLLAIPMMGLGFVGWGGMPGHGVAPVWGLGMALVWLLVLLGVGYLLFRAISGESADARDPAIEELRAAYARGDLTDEEFDRRRERLQREE